MVSTRRLLNDDEGDEGDDAGLSRIETNNISPRNRYEQAIEKRKGPSPKSQTLPYPTLRAKSSLPSLSDLSEHAGRLSPQKRVNDLDRHDQGVRIRETVNLRDAPAPPSLIALFTAMRKISRGRGIVPEPMRDEFEKLADIEPDLVDSAIDDACLDDGRDELGHIPDPESILRVFAGGSRVPGESPS
ncbi:hypothetical protein EDB81DRAFT_875777 [Dactylonectria macrodidyma]|uniref:Uncharacterized protein n=1 Tax=Dactylonectria macrodidyma TaxID=307937 RepID=A0A9P9FVF8_9HYPO|nr:hypothetical protein EDB81DRAFT_875777 [Dactylonectria macrodidyma]